MKQIILPSTILDLTWLVIDDFMEENNLTSSLRKWKLGPPIQKLLKKKYRKKVFSHLQKKYLWVEGEVYTIGYEYNKDTNTDPQKVF